MGESWLLCWSVHPNGTRGLSCSVSPPGTYGTVFKAKDRESGEIVALKVVRLDEDDEVRLLLDSNS